MSIEYAKEFESIVSKARAGEKRMRVALAGADSESILKGLFEAEADGFVEPILIGNYVIYEYEPFCPEGFTINVLISS